MTFSPSQFEALVPVAVDETPENRPDLHPHIGQNTELEPLFRVDHRNCQTGQEILEELPVPHGGVLGFEQCQTHDEIREENYQHIPHDCLPRPVPDGAQLRPFLDVPDQLLRLVSLLVEL